MNVFAHVAVARRAAGPAVDDGVLLGAALSDLASFGGFRLLGRSPDPDVRAGMALHHRTDDAFHRHDWFRTRNRAAADDLGARGLPRGAARACAHVGVELLLDGALHHGDDRSTFLRVLGRAAERADVLAPLVDEHRRDGWLAHLEALSLRRGLPPWHDPALVAQRLHAICDRRSRLRFQPSGVVTVTAVLADLQGPIADTAAALVDDLAAELSASG